MKKRLLAFLLALCMAVSLLPTTVFATNTESEETEKEQLYVVLVSGQSNANGVHGNLDVPAIAPEKGNGYWWNGTELVDLNDYVSSVSTSVGWYAPLAAEWEALTGEKVVIIHECYSGRPISTWASYQDGTLTSTAEGIVSEVEACINAIQEDPTKEIVRTGYYWLQGETDAFINKNNENPVYPTIEQYQTAYMAVHEAFVGALNVDSADAPVGGILSCRTRTGGTYKNLELCSMRAAQQDLANQNADIFMASSIMEDWTASNVQCDFDAASGEYSVDYTAGQMLNGIHYNQSGYNVMGLEAADNMHAALNGETVADIEIIAHNGINTYAEGAVIDVKDNMRIAGDYNADEENAAQIVFRPLPLSATCNGVTVTAETAEGELVDVINDSGYIADVTAITEPLIVTVSAGDVEKTFTLYNSDLSWSGEESSFHYYWDFTRNDLYGADANGYVTVDSVLDDNTLTYTAKSATHTPENGLTNYTDRYFDTAETIQLPKNEPWTIRWVGSNTSNSVLLSDNDSNYDNGGRTTPYIYVKYNASEGYEVELRKEKTTATGGGIAFARTKEQADASAVWTMVNDGKGTVTLTSDAGYKAEGKFTADSPAVFSFDGVLGRFGSKTKLCYNGTIQSLDIFTADRADDCVSIEVTTAPDQQIYNVGDTFNADGMVVTKYTSGGAAKVATGYTVDVETIAADTTKVTVTYEEKGHTYTTTVPVYVKGTPVETPTSYKWEFGNKPATLNAVMGENTLTQDGNCYTSATPIVLHADKPWTIEWQGAASGDITGGNGILLSKVKGASETGWLYQAMDNGKYYINLNSGSNNTGVGFEIGNNTTEGDADKIAKFKDVSTVWRLVYNGKNSLTLTGTLNGETFFNQTKTATLADHTFNYVLGSWSETGSPLNYGNNAITYLAIYEDGATGVEATLKAGTYRIGDVITKDDLTVKVNLADGSQKEVTDFSLEGSAVVGASEKELTVNVVYAGDVFSDTVTIAPTGTSWHWDFTDSDLVSGNKLTAAAGNNNLTYSADTIPVTAEGLNNTSKNYFVMDQAIELPDDSEWTIRWKGSTSNQSVLLANNTGIGDTTSPKKDGEYIYLYNDSKDTADYRIALRTHDTSGGNAANFTDIDLTDASSTVEWFMVHDGKGNLTLAAENNGALIYLETVENAITRDYTFNGVLGYFAQNAKFCYTGVIEYLNIELDAISWDEDAAVDLTMDVSRIPTDYIPGVELDLSKLVVKNGSTILNSYEVKLDPAILMPGDEAVTVTVTAVGTSISETVKVSVEDLPQPANHHWVSESGDITKLVWAKDDTADNPLSWKTGYYSTARPIYLMAENTWQIQWTGAPKEGTNAILLSCNSVNGVNVASRQEPYLYIRNGGDKGVYDISLCMNGAAYSAESYRFVLTAEQLADTNTTWGLTYQNGVLTLSSSDGYRADKKVELKNIIFNGVCGYYELDNYYLTYEGTLTDIKVLENAVAIIPSNPNARAINDIADVNAGTCYDSINSAIAAVETQPYSNDNATTLSPTTVRLLQDTAGGFDIGDEADKYATQNIVLDLNGHTLTLGEPPVGSRGTETNGIRVLAHSKLVIQNGTIVCGDGTEPVKIGIANYGELELNNVKVLNAEDADILIHGINNRGMLTLSGETVVENGTKSAITNEPYNYSYTTGNVDEDCVLNIASDAVKVGKVQVELDKVMGNNDCENTGVPVINISAGQIEEIFTDGDYKKADGNITGGTFGAAVPAELCGKGFIPTGADEEGKYTVKVGEYVAKIGNKYFESINAAIDEAPVETYKNDAMTSLEPTEIELLKDTSGGFDIGDESQKYATQNIILNLNGHTLTLGKPPVGSNGTETNGIRVLAHSKLVLNNGTIECPDTGVKRVIQNYGDATLNDVTVNSGKLVEITALNCGTMTLSGKTSIANGETGDKIALWVEAYMYMYETDWDAVLNVADDTVNIGKTVIGLGEMKHTANGAENKGVPVLNISGGNFDSIATDGENDKTPEAGVSGGTFGAAVPYELCAEGYIPTGADEDGKYTVKVGAYAAKVGDKYFVSINDAIASIEKQDYNYDGMTTLEPTTVELLKDTSGGFDVGVETNVTHPTQNIILDLNGHTLTLGQPPVGSTNTATNGIRILPHSKLVIKDGTIACPDILVKRVIQNYGDTTLENVTVMSGAQVGETVGNFGTLTLSGSTSIENGKTGDKIAMLVSPYPYSHKNGNVDVDAVLNVASEDVKVGKVEVSLNKVEGNNDCENEGVPAINISAGEIESIYTDGEYKKVAGNISGGTYKAAVPADLCAVGYVPAENGDGTYGVEVGTYVAEMKGVKYTSINAAVAAAEKQDYNYDEMTTLEPTTIKLLANTSGGFDIGVEAATYEGYRMQNIVLDLNGHTLTLGKPPVGSANTTTNGIRIMPHSKFVLMNGTIACPDIGVKRVIQNYGDTTLEDVTVNSGALVGETVGNRGILTLKGDTTIANGKTGDKIAIVMAPFNYSYKDRNIEENTDLNIADSNVKVGKILVELDKTAGNNGCENTGVPVINISAGTIDSIATSGDYKEADGNITGGTFSAAVPYELCGKGFIPTGADEEGKYTVKVGEYVAKIGDKYFESINAAIDEAPVETYKNDAMTSLEPTEIELLKDTSGGFDIGDESQKYATQNIILNLNGHTLTLGKPPVGSNGTETNGIRVLAHSKLVLNNGTIECPDTGVKRVIQNYGDATLTDVTVNSGALVGITALNCGTMTLAGNTSIANGEAGEKIALWVEAYMYMYETDWDAVLNVADDTVDIGKTVVGLGEMKHTANGAENKGVPVLNITGGNFDAIATDGETYKTPEAGVSGGTFDVAVPYELCAEGYIPTGADEDGKYTVKVGEYVAKIGDKYYESINEAIDAAPTEAYVEDDNMTSLKPTTIDLLKDTSGGFDIGDESQKYATQNIILNLNGHKLTLGEPPVGSGSVAEQDNGIRVLAHSKLVINDGEIICPDEVLDNVINNYGYLELNDVKVGAGDAIDATIKNRGELVLNGESSVANGGADKGVSILVSPYDYSYKSGNVDVDAVLTIESKDVKVGKVEVSLNKVEGYNDCENAGVPVINISAGEVESIYTVGDYKKADGNITGGSFGAAVPNELCAEGYIPTGADEDGKYTVEKATDRVITRIENDAEYAFSADGKTLNIKNELACVVIIKDGDNYSKLAATRNDKGGYDYDVSGVAASAEIIVAIKGDFDLDGEVTMKDATSIMNAWVNDTPVDEISELAVDMNDSGAVDMSDATSVMNAWVNDTGFSW